MSSINFKSEIPATIPVSYTEELVNKNLDILSGFVVGDLPYMYGSGEITKDTPEASRWWGLSELKRKAARAYKEEVLAYTFAKKMALLLEQVAGDGLEGRELRALDQAEEGQRLLNGLNATEILEQTYRKRGKEQRAEEIKAIRELYLQELNRHRRPTDAAAIDPVDSKSNQNEIVEVEPAVVGGLRLSREELSSSLGGVDGMGIETGTQNTEGQGQLTAVGLSSLNTPAVDEVVAPQQNCIEETQLAKKKSGKPEFGGQHPGVHPSVDLDAITIHRKVSRFPFNILCCY